ncbi:MAG: zf-HC2 domain-containing protein [Candidatus Aminicenantes bacterium]|nr:zf-HC2 domain-containing protein [Candidatus Aminicenantes bacterium]NLH75735.1 hypothetical protein [Acidobacteriota bacterium]
MTCRTIRRLMPLAAGDDLRPRRARAFRAHLDACPACREELRTFHEALATLRTAATDEGVPDWTEAEWRALMARAAGQAGTGEAGHAAPARPAFRPRWAAASAAGALIGLVALALLFRGPVPGPEGRVRAGAPAGGTALAAGGQDVLSMTMVSRETGLQIVWFFDKNFDYKGENE